MHWHIKLPAIVDGADVLNVAELQVKQLLAVRPLHVEQL